MKKFKYIVLVLSFALILTGCKSKEDKGISEAANNTSLSSSKVNSYRVKVSIRGTNDKKSVNMNYIVLNKGNKNYKISLTEGEDTKQITIQNKKTTITDSTGKILDEKLEYDYTNTDLFLTGLNKSSDNKTKEEKIDEETYTIYEFNVSNSVMNKIVKPFSLKSSGTVTGTAYVDKNNQVYLIMYTCDNLNISVSYTRLSSETVK